MLRTDVAILQVTAFFVCVKEDLFRFRSQVQFGGLRNAIAKHDPLFDLASDAVNRQRMS